MSGVSKDLKTRRLVSGSVPFLLYLQRRETPRELSFPKHLGTKSSVPAFGGASLKQPEPASICSSLLPYPYLIK